MIANPRPLQAPTGPDAAGTAGAAGTTRTTRRAAGPHPGRGGLRHVQRHPADVLRVLAGSVVVAAGAMAAHRGHVFGFEANLFRLVNQLPDAVGRPLLVVMQLGALAAVPALAALALAARRPWLARDLAVSGALAWVAAKLVKGLVGEARPVALLDGVVVRGFDPGLGYPSGHVAVAAALATAAGPWLPRPARRAAWWAVWLVALGRMYAGAHLPLDVLGGAALGWAVAAAVHLALGAPGGLPTGSAIRQGLAAAGIEPLGLQPVVGDARGSVPFVVEVGDGRRLFVKAVGPEQRDADLLYKLWRRAAYREVEDETPFASAKQEVEHEAYLGLLAARAGVRTPAVVAATPTEDGHMLLVQDYVAGQTLDRLDPAAVHDGLLEGVWAEVGRLRAAGIATATCAWPTCWSMATGDPGCWTSALPRPRPAHAAWPATSPSCSPRWPAWSAPTGPSTAPPRPSASGRSPRRYRCCNRPPCPPPPAPAPGAGQACSTSYASERRRRPGPNRPNWSR